MGALVSEDDGSALLDGVGTRGALKRQPPGRRGLSVPPGRRIPVAPLRAPPAGAAASVVRWSRLAAVHERSGVRKSDFEALGIGLDGSLVRQR